MKAHFISTLAFAVLLVNSSFANSAVSCYGDYIPPVAICDAHTVVSLTSDGKATVYASTFDDGSYDNCGIETFKVARMNPGWCPYGVVDDTQFRPYVQFCCEDIGSPVWVIFRVIDKNGNYNDCMVEVIVQDKLPPSIHCPYDKTVSCDYWFNPEELYNPNSPIFGSATAYDNCGLEYIYVNVIDNTTCHLGKIKRVFTAVDWGGQTSQCIQHIWVVDYDPFNKYDIDWPNDYTMSGCGYAGTDPDDLPYGFDRPHWNDNNCSLIGAAYDDLVFEFVEGVCKKILRTWTVIDWCQYDPHNPYSKGIWTHVQIIKLIDHDKPIFENCKDTTIAGLEPTCAGKVILDPMVWDVCTPKDKLDYEYKIDIGANGTIDIIRKDRQRVNEILPVGHHKVLWFVDDGCGNLSTCSFHVWVTDGKAPTPVCYYELSTALMPAGGMVTLWAKDYDASSFDNCTPVHKLKFSFSPNYLVGSKNFTCDYVGTNEIKVYVTDEAGNQAYCNVKLKITDNNNVCESMHPLSGAVYSYNGMPIQEAAVGLYKVMTDESMQMDKMKMTNEQGEYLTGFGTTEYNRMLEVTRDGGPLEGISTVDLQLLQNHVFGIELITDPAILYAADVDGSGHVGVNDLIMLRDAFLSNGRSLLGQELPWTFYPAECSWEDVGVTDECQTSVEIDKDNPPVDDIDFIGVKKGDIDGSLLTDLSGRSPEGLFVKLNVAEDQSQGVVRIDAVAGNTMEIGGFQMSMLSDMFASEGDVTVDPGLIRLGSESYRVTGKDRSFNTSWVAARATKVTEGDKLFTIELKKSLNGDIRNLISLDGIYQDQVYTWDQQTLYLILSWGKILYATDEESGVVDASIGSLLDGTPRDLSGFRSEQKGDAQDEFLGEVKVWPNPTYGETIISFEAPGDAEYFLDVYSSDQKIIYRTNINAARGTNKIILDAGTFGTQGVYYFRISGEQSAHTGKVIYMR